LSSSRKATGITKAVSLSDVGAGIEVQETRTARTTTPAMKLTLVLDFISCTPPPTPFQISRRFLSFQQTGISYCPIIACSSHQDSMQITGALLGPRSSPHFSGAALPGHSRRLPCGEGPRARECFGDGRLSAVPRVGEFEVTFSEPVNLRGLHFALLIGTAFTSACSPPDFCYILATTERGRRQEFVNFIQEKQ
jgi:hypothetical protein